MNSDENTSHFNSPLLLTGFPQQYAWGMDRSSLVGQFSGDLAANDRYAELWFGDHPNGPARVAALDTSLRTLTSQHATELLGTACIEKFGARLPFLFKILSVGSALSIQAHPDAHRAPQLHKQDPDHYPDPFPKPEVGYALSKVELLYGFRMPTEILAFLTPGEHYVPEFALLISPAVLESITGLAGQPERFLRTLYTSVMQAPAEKLAHACTELYNRLHHKKQLSAEENWIARLQDEYPRGDVGLFSFYILNLVTVKPGEALFIGPNIAHAYLHNQLAECMAPSDNVVRAGLTPKFIDVETLLTMLEYRPQPPQLLRVVPDPLQPAYGELSLPHSEFFQFGVFTQSNLPVRCTTAGKVELVFALEGTVTLATAKDSLSVPPGQAALIPAQIGEYSVAVHAGQAFRIRTP